MRLYTPIGAFPLIANNPLYHVGMFICTLIIYITDTNKLVNDDEFDCPTKIRENSLWILILHIISAVSMFTPFV